jgi:hypothetical protein
MGGREMGERRTLAVVIAAGIVAIVLSRLPQWFGGQLVPDGDECVVALMAKHLAEGRDVSVFFWGQRYGLAIFESGTAAAAFRLFWPSDAALKGAMLFLWSIGWIFYVLATDRWAGRRVAILAGACLILCPGWASFSMKARGGYVTAFVFTGLVLWIVARESEKRSEGSRRLLTLIGLGACVGLLALAQTLWLLPAVPLIAQILRRDRLSRDVPPLALGFVVVVVAAMAAPAPHRSAYWTPLLLNGVAPWRALIDLPRNLWLVAGGSVWMDETPPTGPFIDLAGVLWVVGWCAATVWAFVRPPARWLGALLLAGWLSIIATVALRTQYRYFAAWLAPLAIVVGAAFAAALAGDRRKRALAAAGLTVLLAASGVALRELGRVNTAGFPVAAGTTAGAALDALLARLRAEGVRHVYSADPFEQWNVMWASREQITARWFSSSDRVPAYPAAVDRALFAGERVAVVWTVEQTPLLADKIAADEKLRAPAVVAGTFNVVVDPGVDTIRRLGFRLNEPGAR